MDWLLLAAFGIVWAAFLVPWSRRRSESKTVEDFEERLELLAHAGVHGTTGRWIVTPRKGVRFLGPQERHRARNRERRKKVLIFLIESIGLTFLIGLAPPLRPVWYVSGALAGLLLLYIWLLLAIKHRATDPHDVVRAAHAPARVAAAHHEAPGRYVADGPMAWARPAFNGLGSLGEGDAVHVVVRPAAAG